MRVHHSFQNMVQMMADLLFNEYSVGKNLSLEISIRFEHFLQDRGKTECYYSNIQDK